MKVIRLKNNKEACIRKAEKEDAGKVIKYLNMVGGESDFLTFGLNEVEITIEQEEAMIEDINSNDNSIMIIMELQGDIIACASFRGGMRKRLRHIGEFGLSVAKEHWGLGAGEQMLSYLIHWAKDTGIIRKINLKVRGDNEKAINLYKKLGFEKEGVLRRDTFIDGEFYDNIQMGLLID